MSKIATGIIIGLLVVVAAGCWGIFVIEKGRQDLELRQLEAQRQAALESEAHGAWNQASRWQSLWIPLGNASAEPKRAEGLSDRSVWVKSYQRSDVKSNGKSKKYGNASYTVSFVMGFHDRASREFAMFLLRRDSKTSYAAVQGVWKHLLVQCKVERLDGGDWIASDYKFTPLSTPPDFPSEKIKGDD